MSTALAPVNLLTPQQVAEIAGVPVATLANLRRAGKGPRYLRVTGKCVRYRLADVELWISAPDAKPISLMDSASPETRQALEACEKDVRVSEDRTQIYFILTADQQFVKIGFAIDPASRFWNVQTGCPYDLELHYAFPGSPQLEQSLHRIFGELRVRGEWFQFSAPIRDFIFWLKVQKNGVAA